MIARILSGLLVAALALAAFQTFNLARSDHELKATQALLAQQESANDMLKEQIDRSESARQAEREQSAADFAGEVERGKIEVAKASKAALARSQITGICPHASTPAERLAALRANSGESK